MELKALDKARRRFRVAKSNAESLETATTYEEFADHWYVFLHAAKGIYTTLEQGAKATPQARQWFARKNQERKSDPLLRYITEARNDDEHGIEESTQATMGQVVLGVSEPGSSSIMRDQFGNTFVNCNSAYAFSNFHPMDMQKLQTSPYFPRLSSLDGKPVINKVVPPKLVLTQVRDRSGKIYDPPKLHLDKPLVSNDPKEVAGLTITYLAGLLAEAEGLHKP